MFFGFATKEKGEPGGGAFTNGSSLRSLSRRLRSPSLGVFLSLSLSLSLVAAEAVAFFFLFLSLERSTEDG